MSDLYLTDKQYLVVLRRVRKRIAESTEEVTGYDDTTVGSKHTHCEAGLCCDDPKVYTKEMNLFPDQYPGRVSDKYRKEEHYCPLAGRKNSSGCFYGCLFFKEHLTDKKKILALYDQRIIELETKRKNKERKCSTKESN